jgi:nucleotide-binding universal stress UspA family protein
MAIETVLVAVGRGDNETERIDAQAGAITDLAASTDAAFTLLHVFGETELEDLIDQLDFDATSDADADAVARRHSATRALGDRLETAGVGYTVRGEVNDEAATGVVAVADELDADRILVGGRDRTPTGKVVFGSVAQQVLLEARCPVTYVQSG